MTPAFHSPIHHEQLLFASSHLPLHLHRRAHRPLVWSPAQQAVSREGRRQESQNTESISASTFRPGGGQGQSLTLPPTQRRIWSIQIMGGGNLGKPGGNDHWVTQGTAARSPRGTAQGHQARPTFLSQ